MIVQSGAYKSICLPTYQARHHQVSTIKYQESRGLTGSSLGRSMNMRAFKRLNDNESCKRLRN